MGAIEDQARSDYAAKARNFGKSKHERHIETMLARPDVSDETKIKILEKELAIKSKMLSKVSQWKGSIANCLHSRRVTTAATLFAAHVSKVGWMSEEETQKAADESVYAADSLLDSLLYNKRGPEISLEKEEKELEEMLREGND